MTRYDRRQVLRGLATTSTLVGLPWGSWLESRAAETQQSSSGARFPSGVIIGEPAGARVGQAVLSDGGNAVDAIVAAALAVTIAAPYQTGIGGYGAHGVFAMDGGRDVWALDANSTAPAALAKDAFKPNDQGEVPGRIHELGWLAAGVPGILAGLQLALDRFGTQRFADLVRPAIQLAREGVLLPEATRTLLARSQMIATDPGSRKLYLVDNQLATAQSKFRNPELAELLEQLARDNSVHAFYQGAVADQIVAAFAKQGGLLVKSDLANYRAKLTRPLTITIGDLAIHTAPLTAGGLTVLQILQTLRALGWPKMAESRLASACFIEAARAAWHDRLTLLGDPDFVEVPQAKLLGGEYAEETATRVRTAVAKGRPNEYSVAERVQPGTIHLSAADRAGNFAALTLTHGGSFGAQVTVEGLGLTLGHGMSRFDPRPEHPNSPGPGKRPLNNMAPTILFRDGRAVSAVGGRGGRKIPNSVLSYLAKWLFEQPDLEACLDAPRMHTEGSLTVEVQPKLPADEQRQLSDFGYQVKTASMATLSAVAVADQRLVSGLR